MRKHGSDKGWKRDTDSNRKLLPVERRENEREERDLVLGSSAEGKENCKCSAGCGSMGT